MQKAHVLAGLAAAMLLTAAPPVLGHGGRYPGPTDTVPPNTSGGDTTGPGNPGNPSTPVGPGPTTPGGGPAPSTGNTPGAPTGQPGSSAPRTPAGFMRKGASGSWDQWEFWWEANDDAFLALKERLRQQRASTQGPTFAGRGVLDQKAIVTRLATADFDRIQTALLAALGARDADVVDSAVLALARITPAERGATVLPAIMEVLAHPERTARESAALALGVLGAPEAVGPLRELLLDTPAGRQLCGQPEKVETLVRAFAAASLGMIGRPEDADALRRVIVDDSLHASADVKSLAILGLGLIKSGHEPIVPFLQQLMSDRSLAPLVRAQAPIALARLHEQPGGSASARAALSHLVGLFVDDRTDHDLRRSLAVALGRLATVEDAEALAALHATAVGAKDPSTRHFSMMALADVAARDPQPERNADVQRRLHELFRTSLMSPKPATQQPYGALALAVQARNPSFDRELRDESVRRLAEVFADERNPSYQGACAIALGLLAANEVAPELAEAFTTRRDVSLRGYVAVGLGLMLDRSHAGELRTLLEIKGVESRMKLQLARALGLMGDPRAVSTLARHLESAGTISEVASTAQALGLIGDRNAIEPLVRLLEDAGQAPQRRGFAAVALGLIAEKTELPWNAVFTIASNYRAKTPALAEIFDIL